MPESDNLRQKKHVFMLVYGNVPNDPRVVSEGTALVNLGYQVRAVGVALYGGISGNQTVQGMDVCILPVERSYNPLRILRASWRLLLGKPPAGNQETASTVLSILFFNLWLIRLALGSQIDLIHCHEHQGLLAAWILSKIKRVPWVYDVHESTPEHRAGMGLKASMAVRVEEILLRRPQAVITVGERLAAYLRKRGARQVVVIGNWKRAEDFEPDRALMDGERDKLELDNYSLVISYFGMLRPERQLMPLVEAVQQSPDVALLIGGRGPLDNDIAAVSEKAPNIHWLGWIPLSMVATYTNLSDVVYCCVDPELFPQHAYIMPNKLFESFIAGKAIIARRGVGEMGVILEEIRSGILLDEATQETLTDAFQQLQNPQTLSTLQEQALLGREQHNWDMVGQRLSQLYTELAG